MWLDLQFVPTNNKKLSYCTLSCYLTACLLSWDFSKGKIFYHLSTTTNIAQMIPTNYRLVLLAKMFFWSSSWMWQIWSQNTTIRCFSQLVPVDRTSSHKALCRPNSESRHRQLPSQLNCHHKPSSLSWQIKEKHFRVRCICQRQFPHLL